MKNLISKLSLSFLCVAVSACSLTGKNISPSSSTSDSTTQAQFVGTAGVKNVNQLLLSMATVTNIPVSSLGPSGSNAAITAQYQTISPFLSPDGSVASVNPAMLLSITGLAGMVCGVFVANEASAPNVLANTGVVFTGSNWSRQFTSSATVSTNVINTLSNQFWGRSPTSEELSTLVESLQSTAGSVPDTGTQGVEDILIVPCTIMLSSPAFLMG